MAEIRQLPPEVADRISAGEVIERPASVVKELIENSIDAGSNKISIIISGGGKDKIRVKDNGSGIASRNLELAFARYATSKINDVNDLYALKTLGFRGEALASIASVSRVEVLTRKKGEEKGVYLLLKGGEKIEKRFTGCPVGTDITITDLFYNTPARYKYLKTVNTEFGHISDIVNREALAYPGIKFKLVHNNKEVLKTPGTGKLKDCIFSIFGQELTEELIPVDFEDEFIKVSGYIANPNYNRSSRVHEYFFVNKRAVHNRKLNQAVEEAYRGLISPGKKPVVFLFLKLNPILIDVNVHPTKREVRFSRNKIIGEVLSRGLKEVLAGENTATRLKVKEKKEHSSNYTQDKLIAEEIGTYDADKSLDNKKSDSKISTDNKTNYQESSAEVKNDHKNIDEQTVKDEINETTAHFQESQQEKAVQPIKILGQVHNTYIIVEAKDGMLIIDQHTAHERVLYDELKQRYEKQNINTQQLLIPVQIELTVPEREIINKYKPLLNKLGFNIEEFSSKSFLIREVPVPLKKAGKDTIREIIDKVLAEEKHMQKYELQEEVLQYMSCRGAVKAGEKLEREEMKRLINDLFQSSNPFRCPHQRPIILHLDNKHLERSMGRI